MYKLITSAEGSDDLTIGFDRDLGRRRNELTNNKTVKGTFRLRIMVKDVIGFAEWQEKATYGLGYKLTLTKNSDNAVLNKENAIAIGKVKINAIEWYVPHYTPSITQQNILMNQNVKKTIQRITISREICFYERTEHTESLEF